jgi:O-antigen/teichoic acid export membrane protein
MICGGGIGRFLSALGPTAVALGVQFLTFTVTARGLGVEAFGEYAAVLGLATIGVELVGLGGADLLVRAVARDRARFSAFYGNLLLLLAATLVPVVLTLLWLALYPMRSALPASLILLALFGEIVVGRVSASVELAMVAHGETFRASCVRLATATTRFAAALAFFSLAHDLAGWVLVVLVQSLVLSSALLLVARWLYGKPIFRLQRAAMPAGAAFALNQVARAAQGNLDRVILARFADATMLGTYAAGSRVLAIGLFPLQVMTRIFYPNFFRHGEHGLKATRAYAMRCLPAMLGASVAACVAVAVVAQAMPKVLGHDFARSTHAAVLLGLSLPLIAMQYLAGDALTGAGLQHVRAVIYGVAAVAFGMLLVLGARLGGTNGLIGAYLGAHAILMVVLWVVAFLWRRGE